MAWTQRSRSWGLIASFLLLIGSAPACGTRALDLGGGGKGGGAGGQTSAGGGGGTTAAGGSGGAGATVGDGGTTGGGAGGTVGSGGTPGGAGGAPPKPCARESDCPSGMVCGYPINGGCDAQGVCVPRGGLPCNALLVLCGCEGGFVVAGCNYAGGYAPAPTVADYARCADASTDPAPGQCRGWGQSCGSTSMCCGGLGCSPSGSTGLPGSCVPL